jgi:hypothetical protein
MNTLLFGSLTYQECVTVAEHYGDLARDGARGYTGNGCPICPDGLAMTAFYLEERWRPDVLVGSDIDYPLRAAA